MEEMYRNRAGEVKSWDDDYLLSVLEINPAFAEGVPVFGDKKGSKARPRMD